MKKYFVNVSKDGYTIGFAVLARDAKSAQNKAVRRAQDTEDDKTITVKNVTRVEYIGFYLARKFIEVSPVLIKS